MDNVIKFDFIEKEGKKLVSARELFNFLESKGDFSSWIKRMFKYGFEEGVDFLLIKSDEQKGFSSNLMKTPNTGGRPEKNYALTLDCAKEISMLQRTEKGKQARRYFIEVEKKATKEVDQIDILQSLVNQLRANRDQIKDQSQRLLKVEARTETRVEAYSVIGYATLVKEKLTKGDTISIAAKAKKYSQKHEMPIDETFDARYGAVKVYLPEALEHAFSERLEKEIKTPITAY